MTDLSEQAVDLDEVLGGESVAPASQSLDAVDEQTIARLAGKAREGGLALTGEGGLLAQLTKRLVESALDGEITDHLGYDGSSILGGHRRVPR
jgi:putative transposase